MHNDHDQMVDRVLLNIRQATGNERLEGEHWYGHAHMEMAALHRSLVPADRFYGVTLEQVCKAAAALSPRVRWEHNIRDVEQLLRYGAQATVHTYSANKTKALELLQGSRAALTTPGPTRGTVYTASTGWKTQRFYELMYEPKTEGIAAIDTWALWAMLGHRPTKQEVDAYTRGSGRYMASEKVFQEVSEMGGITAGQAQAIAWVKVRNEFGRNYAKED